MVRKTRSYGIAMQRGLWPQPKRNSKFKIQDNAFFSSSRLHYEVSGIAMRLRSMMM